MKKESQGTNITSLAAYQTLLDIEKNNNEKLKAEIEELIARNNELNALNKSASIEAVKATILEIDNRLSHYGKYNKLYKYEVSDVLEEVEEELTNVNEKSKTAILSFQEASCRLSRDLAKSADEVFITLAKKEAIKEFAERLKEHCAFDRGFAVMGDDVIDNLVKEMVGDDYA